MEAAKLWRDFGLTWLRKPQGCYFLQRKCDFPTLVNPCRGQKRNNTTLSWTESFCNLFCKQIALNSLCINTASLSGRMINLVKLFGINKKKITKRSTDCFKGLRILPLQNINKISPLWWGGLNVENSGWEGDCKPIILFLACNEMIKVNHSNT